MKFYKRDPDRALAGMVDLSLRERGAYNTILDLLYSRDGCLRDDDDAIRRAMGCHGNEWRAVKAKLIAKGKIWAEGGFLHANGVDEAVSEAADFSEVQRKRVAKRWEKARKSPTKASESSEKPNDINDPPIPYTPIDTYTETKVSGADAPRTLSQIIYSDGLQLLLKGGVKEKDARSLLGMWRKQQGEAAVIDALSRAQAAGAIEPVGFIQGCFRQVAKRGDHDPLANQGIRELEDRRGNFSRGGDNDPPPLRHPANDVSRVQRDTAQEERPMPERDLEAGRDRLELFSLRA